MTTRTCLDCDVSIFHRVRWARLCESCALERKRAKARKDVKVWAKKNPEKRRANNKRWYKANPEKKREADRRWTKVRAARKDALRGPRECEDCGADISTRVGGTSRCMECAQKQKLTNIKRWRDSQPKTPKTPKTCADCGADLSQRPRAKLCGTCAREHKRRWHLKYHHKRLIRLRQHRAENPEKYRKREREKRAKNPQWYREKKRRYKARLLNQIGTVSKDIEGVLLKKNGNRCAAPWCRKSLGGRPTWHLDHIVPLKLGGLHDDANLQILCATCNLKKQAKHPDDWQMKHGRLPL